MRKSYQPYFEETVQKYKNLLDKNSKNTILESRKKFGERKMNEAMGQAWRNYFHDASDFVKWYDSRNTSREVALAIMEYAARYKEDPDRLWTSPSSKEMFEIKKMIRKFVDSFIDDVYWGNETIKIR